MTATRRLPAISPPMVKFIILHHHEENADLYVSVDKIIAFIRPIGKVFTEVLLQQTHAQANTSFGPVCFLVQESPGTIADIIESR